MFFIYVSIIICFIYDPLQDLIKFNTTHIQNIKLIKYKLSLLIQNPYSFKFYTYANTFFLVFISLFFYKYKAAPLLYILTTISFVQYLIQYNFFYLSIINEYISSSKSINDILFYKQYSIEKELCKKPNNLTKFNSLTNIFISNESFYEITDKECFKLTLYPTSFHLLMNKDINLSFNLTRSFLEAFFISFLITLIPLIDFIHFF